MRLYGKAFLCDEIFLKTLTQLTLSYPMMNALYEGFAKIISCLRNSTTFLPVPLFFLAVSRFNDLNRASLSALLQ